MSESAKEGPALAAVVQEVQGWFPGHDPLQAAIADLTLAGCDRADLSVPDERAFTNPETLTLSDAAVAPESPVDRAQIRTLNAGMAGFTGATIAAGAIVATGGAAAPAVAAAAAAGLGTTAISEGIGAMAAKSQVDEYNRRGAAGTLVLAVHVRDEAQADKVAQIMRKNGATETRLVTRADEAVTAGVSASSWTG